MSTGPACQVWATLFPALCVHPQGCPAAANLSSLTPVPFPPAPQTLPPLATVKTVSVSRIPSLFRSFGSWTETRMPVLPGQEVSIPGPVLCTGLSRCSWFRVEVLLVPAAPSPRAVTGVGGQLPSSTPSRSEIRISRLPPPPP